MALVLRFAARTRAAQIALAAMVLLKHVISVSYDAALSMMRALINMIVNPSTTSFVTPIAMAATSLSQYASFVAHSTRVTTNQLDLAIVTNCTNITHRLGLKNHRLVGQ
jgi:hypothetical protein